MNPSSQQCASPDCTFNDHFINCRGNCGQSFHAVCVGLSSSDMSAINSSVNLVWLCDGCRDHLLRDRLGFLMSCFGREAGAKERCCASLACVFNDQFVNCGGSCGRAFHAMCVKLTGSDLLVINSSENIVWFCDGCKGRGAVRVEEIKEEEAVETEAEQNQDDSLIERMDTKFKSIIDGLTKLSDHLRIDTPPDSSPNLQGSGSEEDSAKDDIEVEVVKDKTVFTFGSKVQADSDAQTSWSFSKPTECAKLFKEILAKQTDKPVKAKPQEPVVDVVEDSKATKDENNNPPLLLVAEPKLKVVPTVKKDDSKFYLWIKFLVPHISEAKAERLIRETLRMSRFESIHVHDVIPRYLEYSEITSSSFKVTMDARWKTVALKDSTWWLMEHYDQHKEWIN